jgi:hypothetical protein
MEIAIKSETDSRILIYPLIKILNNYGTVAVYTSNKYFTRLIENELEGGFRNIRIVVNPEADLEAIKESDDFVKNKYDFVLYDNVGAIDYDVLICILTNRLSESYVSDLTYIIQDPKTNILRFGSPAPVRKEDKPKKEKGSKPAKDEEAAEEYTEEDDRNFNKWHIEKTDEQVLKETLDAKKSTWCKFPSFEMFELMESRHVMPSPDDGLIKEVYRIIGDKLSIDIRQFTKGARVKDESSSDISGTDVR